jgi:hypothetical protein
MKKLVVLAAFVLGVVVTHQAIACDWDREASNAPVVVADGTGGCGGSNCAMAPTKPEPDASKVACQGSGCATDSAAPALSTVAAE